MDGAAVDFVFGLVEHCGVDEDLPDVADELVDPVVVVAFSERCEDSAKVHRALDHLLIPYNVLNGLLKRPHYLLVLG